jgi:hypothetical protein
MHQPLILLDSAVRDKGRDSPARAAVGLKRRWLHDDVTTQVKTSYKNPALFKTDEVLYVSYKGLCNGNSSG